LAVGIPHHYHPAGRRGLGLAAEGGVNLFHQYNEDGRFHVFVRKSEFNSVHRTLFTDPKHCEIFNGNPHCASHQLYTRYATLTPDCDLKKMGRYRAANSQLKLPGAFTCGQNV
jgi:hypothetical protein